MGSTTRYLPIAKQDSSASLCYATLRSMKVDVGAVNGLAFGAKAQGVALELPNAPEEVVVFVCEFVALPVARAVLSRAVLFGPGKDVPLPVLGRALRVLGYGRLHHVQS